MNVIYEISFEDMNTMFEYGTLNICSTLDSAKDLVERHFKSSGNLNLKYFIKEMVLEGEIYNNPHNAQHFYTLLGWNKSVLDFNEEL